MYRISLSILIVFLSFHVLFSQQSSSFSPLSFEEADRKADSVLMLMTLKEKMDYIGGDKLFFTQEIPRLNIPSVPFVDATQGIRLNPAFLYNGWKKPAKRTIAYPSPILLASTWNKTIAFNYANSIGRECRAAGLPVLLGPGFNMYRSSQCGRNFEYFGEDPYLVSRMIENYVNGLQETGTIATLKHFIANQTDYYRKMSNSVLDERTLHEIYLPAFKAGIDAGAKAVMTSYNLVNGEWAGQSEYVINHLLREELGFKWLVMTDWWSVWDGEKVIKSGQDLEMPYRKATKDVEKLLNEGKIVEEDIDRMVKRILRTFFAMGSYKSTSLPLTKKEYKQLEQAALNTAREGMVLLKNRENLLPIDISKQQKILATGDFLYKWVSGGGAGFVKGYDNVLLKDALSEVFGDQITFSKNPDFKQVKGADIVIVAVGTHDNEGIDRPFNLPEDQENLVQLYTATNPNTIVLVTSGSGVNMSRWEKAGAILYTWYMGQNGAVAAAEILSGKTNPSGKLPITIEKKFEDSPAYGYIPENESLYKKSRLSKNRKGGVYDIAYDEGIFAGYRWYEMKGIEPEYAFGYGLSYTTFAYSNLELSTPVISEADSLTVKITIQNTGKRGGAETIQLYLGDKECSFDRPQKELKGFEKVFLMPGESREISMTLHPEDFSFWHPEKKEWAVEPGEFEILIGASSRDIRLREIVSIERHIRGGLKFNIGDQFEQWK
ncbi:beta-glucosidase [Bacteroidota bacterium]